MGVPKLMNSKSSLAGIWTSAKFCVRKLRCAQKLCKCTILCASAQFCVQVHLHSLCAHLLCRSVNKSERPGQLRSWSVKDRLVVCLWWFCWISVEHAALGGRISAVTGTMSHRFRKRSFLDVFPRTLPKFVPKRPSNGRDTTICVRTMLVHNFVCKCTCIVCVRIFCADQSTNLKDLVNCAHGRSKTGLLCVCGGSVLSRWCIG